MSRYRSTSGNEKKATDVDVVVASRVAEVLESRRMRYLGGQRAGVAPGKIITVEVEAPPRMIKGVRIAQPGRFYARSDFEVLMVPHHATRMAGREFKIYPLGSTSLASDSVIESVGSLIAAADEADQRRKPEADLATASRRLGAEPGKVMESTVANKILGRIAADASDLFASEEEALAYLGREDFGAQGEDARSLIMAGRTTTVLARLDELRFGVRG